MHEKMVELVSDAELPMKCDGRIIGYYALGFTEALYMAEHLITNDVVPVVRCKDCKFFHDKGYCTKITGLTRIKPEDDFCSHGERKDND